MRLVLSDTCCDYIVVKETLSGKIMHLSSYILSIICNLNFKAVFLKMVKIWYILYIVRMIFHV